MHQKMESKDITRRISLLMTLAVLGCMLLTIYTLINAERLNLTTNELTTTPRIIPTCDLSEQQYVVKFQIIDARTKVLIREAEIELIDTEELVDTGEYDCKPVFKPKIINNIEFIENENGFYEASITSQGSKNILEITILSDGYMPTIFTLSPDTLQHVNEIRLIPIDDN